MIYKFKQQFRFFLLILISLYSTNCGLFEKRYPPDGEFCNVMEKPPTCITVRFESKIIEFSADEVYPMDSVNRVSYYFYPKPGQKVQLSVMTEHRVKLSDGRFYLRKKNKKR
ncbi:MAG: hypothetical protein JJT78_16160 [Leptospira sp.]|nr:hypothetical protein [Leptospira sp.]